MSYYHTAAAEEVQSDFGLIGLGVMGQNLALNVAEHGFTISVWNRSEEKTKRTVDRANEEKVSGLNGFSRFEDFIASIKKPRPVMILVKAGRAVDDVIANLVKVLEPNDIIIDGGNEWFKNTERRAKEVAEYKLQYVGMGVSGGEEGARNGPSLMPGGPVQAYKRLEKILRAIAAQVGDEPCVTHIGPGGAGNYVKTVHNGIEYGDMQLIAESSDLLRALDSNIGPAQLADIFQDWNKGELKSFLVEITGKIFATKDDKPGKDGFLVDKILDKTGMKGTGRWTVQEGAEQSVSISVIAAALDARFVSGLKSQRVEAAKVLTGPESKQSGLSKEESAKLVQDVHDALLVAKLCSYAQGMSLIRQASEVYEWGVNLAAVARIWRGGCIIRATFLDRVASAFEKNEKLANLLVDKDFAKVVNKGHMALRRVVCQAVNAGIAVPAFSAALSYYDSYRRARLPAYLTQAQRDFFGAHTYERVDMEGPHHTTWTSDHSSWTQNLGGK